MAIIIRRLHETAEYYAAEELQRIVWQSPERQITPNHIMITAQKNGGLVLGAFDTAAPDAPLLVGWLFGFLGQDTNGALKHCSHQMGTLPGYQNQQIGYRLKLAQRALVQEQGLRLITWTYDPLGSRNAYLNMRKLGAVCATYLRDVYGQILGSLNEGAESDRFQVAWHITSAHVADRLAGSTPAPTLAALTATGVPVINAFAPQPTPHPPAQTLPIAGPRVLIQIPQRFQAIRSADHALTQAWRAHTRALFEAAFAAGYCATDMLRDGERSLYLFEQHECAAHCMPEEDAS